MTMSQKSPYSLALDAFDAAVNAAKAKQLPPNDDDKSKIESCLKAFAQAKEKLTAAEKSCDDFIYDTMDVADAARAMGIDAQKFLNNISRTPA